MAKKLRGSTPRRRTRRAPPPARRQVTRREYAAVVVRMGALEIQIQRNRAIIDLHVQRIAQLQEQIDVLKAAATQQTLSTELAIMPLTTPTVES